MNKKEIQSPLQIFWQSFRANPMAILSSVLILFIVMIAIFAPILAPYDPFEADWYALSSAPSQAHLFGTDEFGRDILSRVMYGARISLYVGIVSVTVGAILGIIVGLIAGFYGGFLDTLIMRSSDVLFAFPGMLLAIAVVAILGPGLNNVIIAVSIFSIPIFARIVRASALSLRNATYVESAKSVGVSNWTLMVRHILPGTFASVIVYYTMRIGTSILTAAGLSFIGLGPEPDIPEWGNILATSRSMMIAGHWHISLFPGLAIFITVLAFNLLGDALRDTLDPKLTNQ